MQAHTFFGNEKKAVPALLGLMNLALHGITVPRIRRRNTLEEEMKSAPAERFDMVVTNPPFGGTENRQIQENFPVQANATELLFPRAHHEEAEATRRRALRHGRCPKGRCSAAAPLPRSRRTCWSSFSLHTVVSLPPGAFAPYSDVKTALLFFERPGPTRETWYYELPLPAGLKKFSKGSPILDEHFAEGRRLWGAWNDYRRGHGPRPEVTATSWIVPVEEIAARGYDLSARNPSRPTGDTMRPAVEITASLLERIRELHDIVEGLHEQLSNGNREEV